MHFSNGDKILLIIFMLVINLSFQKSTSNKTQKPLIEQTQNETENSTTTTKGFLGYFKSEEETKVFWLMTSLVVITLICFFFLMKKFHPMEYQQTETFDKLEIGVAPQSELTGPTILEYFKQKNPLLKWKLTKLELEENQKQSHSERQAKKKIFSDI